LRRRALPCGTDDHQRDCRNLGEIGGSKTPRLTELMRGKIMRNVCALARAIIGGGTRRALRRSHGHAGNPSAAQPLPASVLVREWLRGNRRAQTNEPAYFFPPSRSHEVQTDPRQKGHVNNCRNIDDNHRPFAACAHRSLSRTYRGGVKIFAAPKRYPRFYLRTNPRPTLHGIDVFTGSAGLLLGFAGQPFFPCCAHCNSVCRAGISVLHRQSLNRSGASGAPVSHNNRIERSGREQEKRRPRGRPRGVRTIMKTLALAREFLNSL